MSVACDATDIVFDHWTVFEYFVLFLSYAQNSISTVSQSVETLFPEILRLHHYMEHHKEKKNPL
jgi:hypothetical protein